MEFQSERSAVTILSETIVKSGVSLFNAIKYIYSLAEDDFYNCNIKDVLKIVLNNLTDTSCLQALGLRISDEKCRQMNSAEYNKVLPLIVFSFAVRIPTLKGVKVNGQSLSDDQLRAVYNSVLEKGAENYKEAISENYEETRKLVKAGKPVMPYTSDWYKAYIYTNVPELCKITNKNIFLLGAADILFTMFYSCLEEELKQIIIGLEKL